MPEPRSVHSQVNEPCVLTPRVWLECQPAGLSIAGFRSLYSGNFEPEVVTKRGQFIPEASLVFHGNRSFPSLCPHPSIHSSPAGLCLEVPETPEMGCEAFLTVPFVNCSYPFLILEQVELICSREGDIFVIQVSRWPSYLLRKQQTHILAIQGPRKPTTFILFFKTYPRAEIANLLELSVTQPAVVSIL